ncbi:MAG: hypothetical protein HKP40_03040 [Litoreibacter sp.]|nr:hypothetical protein [Litoreibacter sp.]
MRPVLSFLIATLAISACSPVYYNVAGVREAQASEVTGCKLIGRVSGIPGVYGPLKDVGLKDARRAAMEQAKAQGGNTVVFDPLPEAGEVYELRAQVYSC